MQAWEYRMATVRTEGPNCSDKAQDDWLAVLNKLGNEGWELITERASYYAGMSGGVESFTFTGTLKREGGAAATGWGASLVN